MSSSARGAGDASWLHWLPGLRVMRPACHGCAGVSFCVWVFWLIVLSAALPLSGRADEVDEVLRERVEAMRGVASVTAAGQPIAARVVLPELYERHDFAPLWGKPGSVA